jgi:hypothetical protein
MKQCMRVFMAAVFLAASVISVAAAMDAGGEIPATVEQVGNAALQNSPPIDRSAGLSATRSGRQGVDVWHANGRMGPPNFHHGGGSHGHVGGR